MSGYDIGGGGGGGGGAHMWNPFLLPATPHAGDNNFTGGVLPAGWTVWDQSGTSVQTETYGAFGVRLTQPAATVAFELTGLYQAPVLPTRYRVSVAVSLYARQNAGPAGAGIFLADQAAPTGGPGIHLVSENNVGRSYMGYAGFSSYNVAYYVGSGSGTNEPPPDLGIMFAGFVVDTDAATHSVRPCMSFDGVTWFWVDTAKDYTAAPINFTGAPSSCGVLMYAVNNQSTGGEHGIFRGYRVQELDATALTVDGLRPRGGFMDGSDSTYNGTTQAVW